MLAQLPLRITSHRISGRRTQPFCDNTVSTRPRQCNILQSACKQCSALPRSRLDVATAEIPAHQLLASSFATFLLSELPASAQAEYQPSFDAKSYWVTLGLFVLTAPGLWSLIKRAPKAKVVRRTYEVDGPAKADAVPIDDRARSISRYFRKYNYEIQGTGEVITFVGTYAADKGQAAALVFYTFCSLASIALVLSITVPQVGGWWYLMTLVSPAAGVYYWQRATRQEEIQVKMVTADDDSVTDIIVQGDQEELERFAKELELVEKGKIRVRGLLENVA